MNSNKTVQALWVGLGSLTTFSLSFISAAILSRYFSKQDYGTYKQILFVYNSLLFFFSAGLPRIYGYYLPKYTLEEGKAIANKIGISLTFAGFVFGLFLFVFSSIIGDLLKNPDVGVGLRYFAIVPVFLFPSFGVEGVFAAYGKTSYIAIYTVLSRCLMLLFIVGPVIIYKGNFIYAIYGWGLVSVLIMLLAIYFKSIPFNGVRKAKTSIKLQSLLRYSLPIVGASIGGVAIKASEQFYISRFFGSEVFAEFSNGFIDLPFVAMITGSTSAILMPLFSKIANGNKNIHEILVVWRSALIKSAVLIYPLVIFFIFCAKDIIILLYSDNYAGSAIYFQLAMVVNFFNIIIFAPLLLSFGESKYYSFIHFSIAILAWTGTALVIYIFKSPLAVAIFSVLLSIFKIYLGLRRSALLLNSNIVDIFPIKKLAPILIQSCLSIFIVYLSLNLIKIEFALLTRIFLSFVIYFSLIFATSSIFGINYLSLLAPLFKRKSSL